MSVYTTVDVLSTRVSVAGVDLRVDHDVEGGNQSIEWASRELEFYLQDRYTVAQITASTWAGFACAVLAVYHLCWLRLNAVPGVVAAERERILEMLAMIQQKGANLPGVPRPNSTPFSVNGRVALDRYPPFLTEPSRSVGPGTPPPQRREFIIPPDVSPG